MSTHRQKLFHQTPLKIFSFLSFHPDEVFCEGEVKRATGTSTGSVNQTLKLLVELDLVFREAKGNVYLYRVNKDNPLLKNFKIMETLLHIHDLVKETAPHSLEIVLYGSCADGTNTEKSDIDLFIRTEYKSRVQKIINKYRAENDRLKAVILDPLEIASSKRTDEVFYKEVKKGIILWMGKPIHEEV